jgi:hypothetical protein
MIGRDGVTGLAAAAASLFLFWLTLGLERNPLVPIGARFSTFTTSTANPDSRR